MSKLNQQIDDAIQSTTNMSSEDTIRSIADGLNSDNEGVVANAKAMARAVITTLTPLLFYQYIQDLPELTPMERLVKMFYAGTYTQGNGYMDIVNLPTGAKNTTTPIDNNQWVPTAQTTSLIETYQINFFTSTSTPMNQTFAPEAFCFEKELTIPETQYLEVFKEGNPEKFFINLKKLVNDSFTLFMYDKIAKALTSTIAPAKTVQGSATNAFECWAKDINALIIDMMNYNSSYNYDGTSKYNHYCEKPYIICSQLTYETLTANLQSQLFNNAKFDNLDMFNRDRFMLLGNTITYGDQSTAITTTANQYINDTTVILIEPNIIKWIQQFSGEASAYFPTNFTMYFKHYRVMAMKYTPWAKCVKYTNTKLNVSPNGGN